MPRFVRAAVLLGAATLAVLLAARPALALHEESPPTLRLTSGPPHLLGPGRAWGTVVVFSSDQDLAGLGASRVPGRQVFFFNLFYYDCSHGLTKPATVCPNPIPPALVQVTNGVGTPDNPTVGTPDSSNNRWIAFDADGSYGGATGAVGTHRQVFLKNLTTGELRSVTSSASGDSVKPTVNQLATHVVFESTAPLAGFPTNGIRQLFLYERGTTIVRQLSFGAVQSTGASTNGNFVAFESRADLLGAGGDTGTTQVFWGEYDPDAHAFTLAQLTHGDAPSRRPFVTEDDAIVFETEATNLPGGISGPGTKVFLSTRVGMPTPVTLMQMTDPVRFGDCTFPTASPGDRLAFICTGDPLANGTTGRRLFVLDQSSVTLYQITGSGDVEGPIAATVGEWFMTFATTADLANDGSCGQQLWIVDYNLGFWNAATQPSQLPPDAGRTVVCSNNNFCDGQEYCSTPPGTCLSGPLPSCDDGNPCTTDTCNAITGCVHTPTSGACDDHSLCTSGDMCQNGGCHGTPAPCDDGNACNGTETCNPSTGVCSSGAPPSCDDGNLCTTDACVAPGGCTHTNNNLACNDGDPCTTGDVCSGGTCAGTGPVCGNGVVECGENCDEGGLNGTPGHCTAACIELPPALRIPGTRRATECASEWSLATNEPAPPLPRLPASRQVCVDGDPACDFDPTPGNCRFHVWECFAGADTRIACPAQGVGSVVIQRPRATDSGALGALRSRFLAAIAELGLPVPAGEVCTRRLDVDVPVRGARPALSTLATTTSGTRDRDSLRLRCLSSF